MFLPVIVRRIASVILLLLAAACAAPHAGQAGYVGPPEAVVLGATKKQVIDLLIRAKLEKRLQVRDVSEYGFVATGRLEGNFAAALLFGSRYDTTPGVRLHYSVVDVDGGVKVFVRAEIVTNPGSGFERSTDMTSAAAADIRRELEELQANFAPTKR